MNYKKHIKNFNDHSDIVLNESNKEKNIIDKFFKIFGLDISDDGVVKVSNRMGRLLCNLAVREKSFEKIDNDTYKLI